MNSADKYIQYREPGFIIIGGMKCGTTSLYHYMTRHPFIRAARKKEVHYFDKNYDKGIDWYRSFFPPVKLFKNLVTGEATPRYFFSPNVPGRVLENYPDVKLIALLRNPVDRAYSHYRHNLKIKLVNTTFEETVETALNILETKKDDLYGYQSFKGEINRYTGYLSRGFYIQHLKHWTRYFPLKQLLVLKSEDLFQAPVKTLETVFTFLGLEPGAGTQDPDNLKKWNYFGYPPMNPGTRERLIVYFRPHNRQLYDFLGRDFQWEQGL